MKEELKNDYIYQYNLLTTGWNTNKKEKLSNRKWGFGYKSENKYKNKYILDQWLDISSISSSNSSFVSLLDLWFTKSILITSNSSAGYCDSLSEFWSFGTTFV